MTRTKEVERPRYAAKVRDYLARCAAGDPAAQDLSLDGIRRGAKVSRTPLSQEAESCGIVKALLLDIEEARRNQRGAPTSQSASSDFPVPAAVHGADEADHSHATLVGRDLPGVDQLESKVIAKRIRDAKAQAERAMRDWIARHGAGGSDDVGLAAHDLDRVVWSLRRVVENLVPLLNVRDARERGVDPVPVPEEQIQGGLDL